MRYIALYCSVFILSCSTEKADKFKNKVDIKNVYEIFNEPSIAEIEKYDFYLLISEKYGIGDLTITSIKSHNNNLFCYFKVIKNYNIPPIAKEIKSDTSNFSYTSYFIKLKNQELDSIKNQVNQFWIKKIKDTIGNNDHTDGVAVDIIIKNNDDVDAINRNVPMLNNLDPEIKFFLEKIKSFTVDKIN